jgi:hypothetical protein
MEWPDASDGRFDRRSDRGREEDPDRGGGSWDALDEVRDVVGGLGLGLAPLLNRENRDFMLRRQSAWRGDYRGAAESWNEMRKREKWNLSGWRGREIVALAHAHQTLTPSFGQVDSTSAAPIPIQTPSKQRKARRPDQHSSHVFFALPR